MYKNYKKQCIFYIFRLQAKLLNCYNDWSRNRKWTGLKSRWVQLKHISIIAEKLGLNIGNIEMYAKHKAKLPQSIINHENIKKSNLILATAITPTPAGEGKNNR